MSTINGLTRAASAMQYWERRQEVLAHNLANANTDGFKAERVFARLMGDAMTVVDTRTDRTAGTLRPTHAPLDLALADDAFFVVETPNGERLTRGGSFRLDDDGRIADMSGNLLLGDGGPITVPPGTLEIDGAGVVRVDGEAVGQLRVEAVPADAQLVHEGGTLFLPDPDRQPIGADTRPVRQGFLEDSNVSTIGSMVDMISVQRAYTAVQKAITTLDAVRGTAVSDLGRPV
jgi:flagellar basal-body rod protein FlgF